MQNQNKKPVVVITAESQMFFGYLVDDTKLPLEITLERVRCCEKWTTHGRFSLASDGPTDECQVTPHAIVNARLYNITSIFECTPIAAERWERGVWYSAFAERYKNK